MSPNEDWKAATAMNVLSNYLNDFLENDKVGNKKNP